MNPTFVCDYPEEVSPLSKRKDEDPRLTDRFELVICGHEYANAFSELNDPVDQAGRFAEQVAAKGFGDDEAMGYDYDYVRALEYGMPPAGGIGYGIDRMVMLFCDQPGHSRRAAVPADRRGRHQGGHCLAAARQDRQRRGGADVLLDDAENGASARREGRLLRPSCRAGSPASRRLNCSRSTTRMTSHIKHGETLEGLMRYYAEKYDPENVDFWGQVGLLHDLDWEKWQDDQLHTVKTAELLEEAGADPYLAHAIQTHNSDVNTDLPKPEAKMERVLFACDELSGLIQAAARVRPSGSVTDMPLKSLKKKFKDKRFAAGCDRDVIRMGAELNGLELDDLLAEVLDAMKAIAPVGDIYAKGDEAEGSAE